MACVKSNIMILLCNVSLWKIVADGGPSMLPSHIPKGSQGRTRGPNSQGKSQDMNQVAVDPSMVQTRVMHPKKAWFYSLNLLAFC